MKLSHILIIFLRVFAINWLLVGFFRLFVSIPMLTSNWLSAFYLAGPGVYFLAALLAWIFAVKIAKVLIGRADCDVQMAKEITPAMLFSTAFLGIGLYFFLTYLGGSLNWLHYLAITQAGHDLMTTAVDEDSNFYSLTSSLIPCLAGLALAACSPKLGRKLARATESQLSTPSE
ncbi:hypothetical protein [Roseibacillus persicicus]|uniref:Uncharacterized protein n=1 Tax=Roseibacillus persicicus TaxID=454148 RepID=A0A918WFZ8_9BACT|nr:hypothetical protein [Roseibacillus persicicus]GHC47858.1 hypothetical protein GCM10007100_12080 [Roseibacillus persicicus]